MSDMPPPSHSPDPQPPFAGTGRAHPPQDEHTEAANTRPDEATPQLPPDLRFLRRLVTTLTATMILGLIAIVALLAFRLAVPRGTPPGALPSLPATVALPDGAVPAAVTFARDFTIVVTEDGTILFYGAEGALERRIDPD